MSSSSSAPELLVAVPGEAEAAIIVGALSENGIEATAVGGLTSGLKAEAPGWVSVLVRESDLDRAKQLLEQIRKEATEIDWSNVDTG